LPTLDAQETRRALEVSIKLLGAGTQLTQQMDRVTVTLKGVGASALAQWFSATRQNAHVVPTEAHLKRAAAGSWDGTVVFTLAAQ
jgi:general secretion pathway protein M